MATPASAGATGTNSAARNTPHNQSETARRRDFRVPGGAAIDKSRSTFGPCASRIRASAATYCWYSGSASAYSFRVAAAGGVGRVAAAAKPNAALSASTISVAVE